MTPDDMEAHLEAVARSLGDGDFTRVTFPEGVAKKTATAIRALLLDYQERGRALRPFAEVADIYSETTSDEALIDQEDGLTLAECRRARATLKGKSHE
jgi:hypothetical protein